MSSTPARAGNAQPDRPSLADALRGGAARGARARRRRDPDAPGILASAIPSRDALVDAAFSAALVVIALVGLRTGFLGGAWILAAGVGLGLGLVIAHLATAYRWFALVTFLVLVATYFALGGPVAVRGDLLLGVIPTGQTFLDLATWSVTGWKRWLTLLPPVDARGPVLALPWLAGLLGGALTLGVARRWQSVPVTALVPLTLLVGSIALGTLEPAALVVQGVGFAVVLVGWLVVRSHRGRAPIQNGAGRGARVATGSVLIGLAVTAGLVASPLLPGTDRAQRREVVRTSLVPPLDVSQFASPLPGFRQYTEPNPAELYDREVLRVTGLPTGALVRFATLDAYDGLVFGAADRSTDGVPFQQVGSRIGTARGGTTVDVSVQVPERGYLGPWLPIVGSPTRIEFTGPRADALTDELWLNTDTETALVPAQLRGGESYTMTAVLPDPAPTELPDQLELDGGAASPTGMDFLDSRIDSWTNRADGSWAKLRAAAGQMRTEGTYTDGGTPNSFEKVYLPGHTVARLSRFVGSTKLAGNDEQYAATLALVARRLGIPSRVVMGAEPEADGRVLGKDVHAWVEVRRADGSWFALRSETFVPSRDKTPSEQQLLSEEQKVGAQVPPPAGVNPPSLLQGPDQAQNATDITKRKKSPFDVGAWPWWLKLLVLGLLLPALVLAVAFFLLRWLKTRRRRRHSSTGPVPARVAWVWRDLVAEARSLGVPVPGGVTRREQATSLADAGVEGAPVLAARADAVVFGPGEGSQEQSRECAEEASAVRAQLRARVSRWARLRSDADPRPLLVRPEGSTARRPSRPRLPGIRRLAPTPD
ncbi:MAG: transglutaminase-like domain-containing protein [Ornithinibacter sp.]